MLVVSRKPGQKLVIPAINATIQVVEHQGNAIKLGIDAPREIQFLRDELVNDSTEFGKLLDARQERHAQRNTLNSISVGLSLIERLVQAGAPLQEITATIQRIRGEIPTQDDRELTRVSYRALLVEDDTNEREMLASVLRLAGIEVVAKGDGINALDYLRQEKIQPDVILLDMGLPDMDGKEVIRKMQALPNAENSRLLVVSGRDEEEVDNVEY